MGTETVAVLFTDLVDSTGLIGRIGEEGAEAVRREHFAQLRAAIAEVGGREVKNIGDGLMVVFPSSSRAIAAAVTMQQQVFDRNRGHAVPLGLRVGVAVGEADTDETTTSASRWSRPPACATSPPAARSWSRRSLGCSPDPGAVTPSTPGAW